MRSLKESTLLRFITFGALYLAQGIPWGFIAVGYVVLLSDAGLSNEQVGEAMSWAYVPWSFKIIWGPIIDRFPSLRFGRRRPFIVFAELCMGLTLVALLFVDPKTQLSAVSFILFLHNTVAALQDVASDALAVDILPEKERGRANSVMWASKSAGVAVGGGAGTIFAKYFGWSALFIAMAVMIWAIMLLPLLLREGGERTAEGVGPEPLRLNWRELKGSFSFAAPLVGIAIAFCTPFGYALSNSMFVRMMRADLKLGEEVIATISGIIEPISGVFGALLGGFAADRFGAKRAIAGTMIGVAASMAVFAAVPGHWGSFGALAAYVIARNIFFYAFSAASLGFFMTLSNPAVGATQFAIFMASTNLCYAASNRLGGWMADRYGYQALFFAGAAVQLFTIVLLPFCDHRSAQQRFHAETAPEPAA